MAFARLRVKIDIIAVIFGFQNLQLFHFEGTMCTLFHRLAVQPALGIDLNITFFSYNFVKTIFTTVIV